ncbi:SulP family inorganic anion transporter [Flavihumibacter sp. R14]|nr:SulP family inorganic anion transporter [Flavihumibacter soli]
MTAFEKYIPGFELFRIYRREWFQSDLLAGLSVAAVALPVGIAYAQLAGFPPAMGIYSSILPAIAYAFFGSSRQLVVNPDSAACMMIAATVAPLAAGDALRYTDLSLVLTFITALLCLMGGIAKFGVIANFLSRPILTGYLNGIALSIIASQLGTMLGFRVSQGGFFHTVLEAITRLNETNPATLLLGLSLFVLILILKRVMPRVPAPLIATVAGIAVVYALPQKGVSVVGEVPAGFPALHIPAVTSSELIPLITGAFGIMLVSFCSMMTTARAFAAKNGYRIKVNQDMFALGVSDLASAVTGGFAVSGADSRTAVADSSGGKTQVSSIVAALAIALVLLFLTRPLAFVPSAALAAILISSAIGLFDIASLRRYYTLNRFEFRFSIIATLGVMTIGVLPGVLLAVGLALFKLLRLASRPHDAVLGPVTEQTGVYTAIHEGEDRSIAGILIYRFDSSLVFFNADYFKDRVRLAVRHAKIKPEWLIFDAETIPLIDITGCDTLEELRRELAAEGVVMVIVRAKGLFRTMMQRSGLLDTFGHERFFYSIHSAVLAFQEANNNRQS